MPRRKRAVWRQRHIELAAHGNHFAFVFAIQQVVAALHARERGPAVLERHVLQVVQLVGLYTANILLAQNDRDAGSASALINFSVNIFGVVGMGLGVSVQCAGLHFRPRFAASGKHDDHRLAVGLPAHLEEGPHQGTGIVALLP